MALLHSLIGMEIIEIVSADIAGLLTVIGKNNIFIDSLKSIDEMTIRGRIRRADFKEIQTLTQHRGDKITIVENKGIYWWGKRLAIRPILLSALTLLLLLALVLPGRILFVQVEGNRSIPSKLILEAAEQCGINIFASRRKVRSEKVKNALLEEIPELQWVGVNTAGCVATIQVSEKTVTDQPKELDTRISSIVASRDGIVLECTVRQGNVLCHVGQAVKAGQILVSGYTDCGIKIKATRAEAEIYAQTLRDLQVVTPVIRQERTDEWRKKENYSLLFGKKLIKLYKGSGISDATCVKIYEEIKLTLPGGYQLPVSLIRETIADYNFRLTDPAQECIWLKDAAISYLHSHMIAGQILNQVIDAELLDDVYLLNGRFSCLEMIGQVKNEENLLR